MHRIKHFETQGKEKKVGIMVASHNEDTVRFAIEKMKQLDIKPEHKVYKAYCYQVYFFIIFSLSGDMFWPAVGNV